MRVHLAFIIALAALFNHGFAKPRNDATCPEGTIPSPFDSNTCYKFFTTPLDYFSASASCGDANGYLISIHSGFENQFFLGLTGSVDSFWIGGDNANVNATWRWEDNSPFDFLDWAPGQPPTTAGNCLSVQRHGGLWYSEKCRDEKPFLCKMLPLKPAKPSCPNGWSINSETKECYKVLKGYKNMTCDYARQLCSNLNANLASIHSFRENSFITGMTMSRNTTFTVIGLTSDSSVAWRWQDNTVVNFTRWSDSDASQPNSSSCIVIGGFNTLENWYSSRNQYPYISQAVCKMSGYDNLSIRDSLCPTGTIEGDSNTCYKIYAEASNWYSAQQTCQKENGNLISIHNTDENWFFIGLMYGNVPNPDEFWVGASNNNPNNKWGFIDNTPLDFDNWAPGNPQNTTGLCMSERVRSGFWYSTKCEDEKPFICHVPTNNTPRNSCPPNFSYFDPSNSCYQVVQVSGTKTCADAQQICFNLNSTLASIHSDEENFFVGGLAMNDTVNSRFYTAFGLISDGNVWKWLDGSKLDYSYWYSSYLPTSGDCAVMYTSFYNYNYGYGSMWYSKNNVGAFNQVVCKVGAS